MTLLKEAGDIETAAMPKDFKTIYLPHLTLPLNFYHLNLDK